MNRSKRNGILIPLAAAGFALRYLVYRYAVDEKNLVVTFHPLVITLWVLTLAALGYALYSALQEEKLDNVPLHFPASKSAFLGHGMLAAGMLCTAVLNPAPIAGLLGMLWKLFGILGGLGLLWAGGVRLTGKQPFFGCYGLPCLFALIHVVVHYQLWCSNPQLTDYGFDLLGTVALAFLTYHLSAFCAGLPKRRILSLSAPCLVFFYATAMAFGAYPHLNLGGFLFGLTCLPGTFRPKEG